MVQQAVDHRELSTTQYVSATLENLGGQMVINIGPQHPSTHGVLRLVLNLDGERVVDAEPVLGYMHRGFEKLAEQRSPAQNTALFNRLDWIQGFCNEVPYCIACELLAEVEVPERAQWLRVLMYELNRIASHSLFCGSFGLELGALTAPMYGYRDREYALDLVEMVTGQRMHTNYCRVGGLKDDFPKSFYEAVPAILEYFRGRVDQWLEFLIGNDVFVARTRGIGVLAPAVALDYGVTGPSLRACGIGLDARKLEDYLGYGPFEFDVPTGEYGDAFDRFCLRVREIWESCKIIEQCLEGLPTGRIGASLPRTFKVPPGEIYVRGEAPLGELGYHLISIGEREPYRLKIRTPSFSNVSVLPHLLKGAYLADVIAIIGSLFFIVGDIDR